MPIDMLEFEPMTEGYAKDNPGFQKVDLTAEASVPFKFKSIHKEKLRKVKNDLF